MDFTRGMAFVSIGVVTVITLIAAGNGCAQIVERQKALSEQAAERREAACQAVGATSAHYVVHRGAGKSRTSTTYHMCMMPDGTLRATPNHMKDSPHAE